MSSWRDADLLEGDQLDQDPVETVVEGGSKEEGDALIDPEDVVAPGVPKEAGGPGIALPRRGSLGRGSAARRMATYASDTASLHWNNTPAGCSVVSAMQDMLL